MGFVYLAILFFGWIGFAIFGIKSKWSKTASIGGGFIVGCVVVVAIAIVLQNLGLVQRPNAQTQVQPVHAKPAPQKNNRQALLVGMWYCRNQANYLHKVVYGWDGTYKSWESGYVPGVAQETTLAYSGTYTLNGNVLKTQNHSTDNVSNFSATVRITKLTQDALEKYWPGQNFTEQCFRPLE